LRSSPPLFPPGIAAIAFHVETFVHVPSLLTPGYPSSKTCFFLSFPVSVHPLQFCPPAPSTPSETIRTTVISPPLPISPQSPCVPLFCRKTPFSLARETDSPNLDPFPLLGTMSTSLLLQPGILLSTLIPLHLKQFVLSISFDSRAGEIPSPAPLLLTANQSLSSARHEDFFLLLLSPRFLPCGSLERVTCCRVSPLSAALTLPFPPQQRSSGSFTLLYPFISQSESQIMIVLSRIGALEYIPLKHVINPPFHPPPRKGKASPRPTCVLSWLEVTPSPFSPTATCEFLFFFQCSASSFCPPHSIPVSLLPTVSLAGPRMSFDPTFLL